MIDSEDRQDDEAATKTAPELTRKEKQDYVEQVEDFEGPDRREKRGSDEEAPHEPGVARS